MEVGCNIFRYVRGKISTKKTIKGNDLKFDLKVSMSDILHGNEVEIKYSKEKCAKVVEVQSTLINQK